MPITNWFVGIYVGFLLSDYLNRHFPDEYANFKNYLLNISCNISYNIIYYYGKLQIFLNKYINKPNNLNQKFQDIFVRENINHKEKYNFDIFTYYLTKPHGKKIVSNEDLNLFDNKFEESNVKFILVEFIVGEKTFKINLKTDTYNYYLIGNKLTKDFFIYFINEHLLSKYEQQNFDKNEQYLLKIIDGNVNTFTVNFTNNEYIELYKDSYIIVK